MSSWSGDGWSSDWNRDWSSGGGGGGWERGRWKPEPREQPKKKAKAKPDPKAKAVAKPKAAAAEPKSLPQREIDRLPLREEIKALRQQQGRDERTMRELREEVAERLESHGANLAKIAMMGAAGEEAVAQRSQAEAGQALA